MKRIYFAVVASILALGLLAGPAMAATSEDVGVVVNAAAVVSKNAGDDGCADGTGGGIGLPVLNGLKKAYYKFNNVLGTESVSLNHEAIDTIELCGQLDPMPEDYDNGLVDVPDPAEGLYGAACGGSASSNGGGTAEMADGTDVIFNGIGWKASAGSVFIATGGATADGKAKSGVLALVSARGVGAQCGNKGTADTPEEKAEMGGINFQVDFVYIISSLLPVKKNEKK